MPEETSEYPIQAAGKIRQATRDEMVDAERKFGVKPGTLVRMALEDFMPRYLAVQGRCEHLEFVGQISAAIDESPELKPAIEDFVRRKLRVTKNP